MAIAKGRIVVAAVVVVGSLIGAYKFHVWQRANEARERRLARERKAA